MFIYPDIGNEETAKKKEKLTIDSIGLTDIFHIGLILGRFQLEYDFIRACYGEQVKHLSANLTN